MFDYFTFHFWNFHLIILFIFWEFLFFTEVFYLFQVFVIVEVFSMTMSLKSLSYKSNLFVILVLMSVDYLFSLEIFQDLGIVSGFSFEMEHLGYYYETLDLTESYYPRKWRDTPPWFFLVLATVQFPLLSLCYHPWVRPLITAGYGEEIRPRLGLSWHHTREAEVSLSTVPTWSPLTLWCGFTPFDTFLSLLAALSYFSTFLYCFGLVNFPWPVFSFVILSVIALVFWWPLSDRAKSCHSGVRSDDCFISLHCFLDILYTSKSFAESWAIKSHSTITFF